MPLICESALVPVVLPRLIYLRLCGAEAVIAGFMGLVFDARPRFTPPFNPASNLKLELHEMNKALVPNIIPPFPPKRVSEFAAVELNLFADSWRGMLGEMGVLLHLQLDTLNVGPVLGLLGYDDEGV